MHILLILTIWPKFHLLLSQPFLSFFLIFFSIPLLQNKIGEEEAWDDAQWVKCLLHIHESPSDLKSPEPRRS